MVLCASRIIALMALVCYEGVHVAAARAQPQTLPRHVEPVLAFNMAYPDEADPFPIQFNGLAQQLPSVAERDLIMHATGM